MGLQTPIRAWFLILVCLVAAIYNFRYHIQPQLSVFGCGFSKTLDLNKKPEYERTEMEVRPALPNSVWMWIVPCVTLMISGPNYALPSPIEKYCFEMMLFVFQL